MELKYDKFAFTKILGWSISRYELFDKCKRQYFYNYYSKFVKDVPYYKIDQLKSLTSIPLEVGNIVHDVIEVLLRRLQKDDSSINESKFYDFASSKAVEYVSQKTFHEVYYKKVDNIDIADIQTKVINRLKIFMTSPIFQWIFMNAMTNKDNWMIEPPGYGETRLNGLKAYCKMDFLFPIGEEVHILDWKTGKKDEYKHKKQLIAYAAAANSNFGIPWDKIFPRIVYLNDEYSELDFTLQESDRENFFYNVRKESDEMKAFCSDAENNVPLPIEKFEKTPSKPICNFCNYKEICFKETDGQKMPF